jgi:sigma-B regulation protein RsbU (phosphoserine phosphatase)
MKFSLSTERLYRLLFLLFLLAGARRVTYTIDAVQDMRHAYTASPLNLRAPWPTIYSADPLAQAAGLRAGDRVLRLAGRAPRGFRDFELAFDRHSPGDRIPVTVLRDGKTLDFAVPPALVNFGSGWLSTAFGSLSWILMPWLSFALGFWVAALRPRDPRAWIVLAILLGMAEFTSASVLDARGWPGIGMPLFVYHDLALPVWAICMLLFGIYFPQRWRFDRYAPWFKWAIAAPTLLLALWEVARDAFDSIDYVAALALFPKLPAIDAVLQGFTLMAPCVFFIAMQDKFSDASLPADDRRRLRLLYWGCSAAMGPMFLLILYTLAVHQRMPNDQDDILLAIAFMAMLL